MDTPGIRSQTGRLARVVMMRVRPGTDLIEGIEEACRAERVRSGAIACCIGSLRKATFMFAVPSANRAGATYGDPVTMNGPVEILSVQGMIGQEENGHLFVHAHGSFCSKDGHVQGGHLVRSENPVLITAEVMVCDVAEAEMRRLYDPEVDMNVLMPSRDPGTMV